MCSYPAPDSPPHAHQHGSGGYWGPYSSQHVLLCPQVFAAYIQPKDPSNGQMYQRTLLGAILNISCLLKTPGLVESHGYFLNPSRSSPQEIKVQESNIHQVGPAGAALLPEGQCPVPGLRFRPAWDRAGRRTPPSSPAVTRGWGGLYPGFLWVSSKWLCELWKRVGWCW